MCALGMGGSTGSRLPEVDRMAEKDTGSKDITEISGDVFVRRYENRDKTKGWRLEQRARAAVQALQANGFDAMFVPDRVHARTEILDRVPDSATIGIGGSMTIRETGVIDELVRAGHTVYNHWVAGLSNDESMAIRRAQLTSDVFLSSVNALTLDGKLVSTDGVGNRISAMTFGPKKVILAVGVNKIVRDLQAALWRIKDVCAPLTLKETNAPVPCVQTGICGECQSGARLCRATVILESRPLETDMTVLVVGEEMGF
jgi:hypothetical protein